MICSCFEIVLPVCVSPCSCFSSDGTRKCSGCLAHERARLVSLAGHPRRGMLNGSREGLFELGRQLQQEGDSQAALHCFLSCLLGLTHVQSFHSLPNCLHQVSPAGWSSVMMHCGIENPFKWDSNVEDDNLHGKLLVGYIACMCK